MKNSLSQKGVTLVELLIVITITTLLFGIISLNIYQPQGKASLESSVSELFSQLHEQQMKSMLGDSEGAATAQTYGIHFESTTYTLFAGASYTANNPNNLVKSLGANVVFSSVSLPSASVVFTRKSGEFTNYASSTHTFTVRNTVSTEQKTFNLNRYGIVTLQ